MISYFPPVCGRTCCSADDRRSDGTTQNRLATGKKVNSALDNPSNFFTSQSLSNRASDLNSLLDSIGQAQKTLEAADHGITSLTKLVESAKSIAKQARQAPQPGRRSPTARSASAARPTDETVGTFTALPTRPRLRPRRFRSTSPSTARSTPSTTAAFGACAKPLPGLQRRSSVAIDGTSIRSARSRSTPAAASSASRTRIPTSMFRSTPTRPRSPPASPPVRWPIATSSRPACSTTSAGGGVAGTSTLTVAVNGGANQVITFGTGVGADLHAGRVEHRARQVSSASPASVERRRSDVHRRVLHDPEQPQADRRRRGADHGARLGAIIGTTQGTASVSTPNPIAHQPAGRLQQRAGADRRAGERCLLQRHQPARRRRSQGRVQRDRHQLADHHRRDLQRRRPRPHRRRPARLPVRRQHRRDDRRRSTPR